MMAACRIFLAVLAAAGCAGIWGEETQLRDVSIVVNDEPYTGDLIPPPTDTEFKFKLKETGDVISFRWSSLAESERRRIQKLFGIEIEEGREVWGEEVQCVRFKLGTGKSVEGMELVDRVLPGYRYLKNSTQTFPVPVSLIESEEKIVKRESDIYGPREYFDRVILERPPRGDNASDHLEIAQLCSKIGLYDKAIDYLEMAKVIDPRVEERTGDFRNELVNKHAEQQANKLYEIILTSKFAEDYSTCLRHIDTFLRNFPYSERRTAVEAMRPEIEGLSQRDFSKQVVFMYYNLFNELVTEALNKRIRVDEKGRPVPSIPGKLITTRQGKIFRGVLVSEAEDFVTIKQNDIELKIAAKDVLSVGDTDLSKAYRELEPTFSALKDYVTDKEGGLGKAIVQRIAEQLHMDEAKVKDTWESRFHRTAEYKDGIYTQSPVYTTLHNAYYGKGSWLRDGAQFIPGDNGATGAAGSRNSGRNTGRNSGGGNTARTTTGGTTGSANDQSGRIQMTQAQEVFPDLSDDPDEWWTVQRGDTRLAILRALAAEKLFRIKDVHGKVCPQCAGAGVLEMMKDTQIIKVRCPTCRGLRLLFQLIYE